MQMSQMHYLPIAPAFFAILVGIFFIVLILRSVRYAYESLGVSHQSAMWLLFASLLGSFFNVPIAELPPEQVMSNQVVDFFGMRYQVPVVSHWQGTIIAVNVGGAVIPVLVSVYLLIKNQLWVKGLVATTIVAVILHWTASPVPGLGIAVPVFVPALATAIVAMLMSRQYAAPLAYIGGSLGTLIGADLTNLDRVRGLGVPVASIGGAGTFDGIFLTGILAVLLASFYAPRRTLLVG
ncbi:MAG TPA: DUF1614 domain-containing protein [Pseudolabrys sp.]|jgi:uncharacterized membrane protein|nr:DUF1614 domain-containing protein [Pseudolabrys sp.]